MISAFAHHEYVLAARSAGVHEFIAKPFSTQALYVDIRETLNNPRPFVETGRYVGPDRRWLDIEMPDGQNRRTGPDDLLIRIMDATGKEPSLGQ